MRELAVVNRLREETRAGTLIWVQVRERLPVMRGYRTTRGLWTLRLRYHAGSLEVNPQRIELTLIKASTGGEWMFPHGPAVAGLFDEVDAQVEKSAQEQEAAVEVQAFFNEVLDAAARETP